MTHNEDNLVLYADFWFTQLTWNYYLDSFRLAQSRKYLDTSTLTKTKRCSIEICVYWRKHGKFENEV